MDSSKPYPPRPFWDDYGDRTCIWFVIDSANGRSVEDFAVIHYPRGDEPMWTATLISPESGTMLYHTERKFATLAEARDWIELTYALES